MRLSLGSANSRLTTHCRETLAHTVTGILTRLCCYYHQHLQWNPVHWILQPSFSPGTTPTYHTPFRRSGVSVVGFSPVHLRGPQARQVSCYALFKGWLLLSLPPCCLCLKTPFRLTLSQHSGTLTPVRVVPLSVVELTSHKPASRLLRC